MRVVLGVVDEHDRECGARPIAIAGFAPYLAKLRDDAPIARCRPAVGLAHHLAALYRYQHIANREELELHAREDSHVAPLDQRLPQNRKRLHPCRMSLEDTGEARRR